MPPITTSHTYNAPISKVWQALTDPAQMQKWYFNIPAFRAEKGFRFSFSGTGSEGEEYIHDATITEVIPEKKLQHIWTYRDREGKSLLTIELFPEGDRTRLELKHEGVETFPKHKDFARESFQAGWDEIMGKNLKRFAEQ